MWRPSSCGPPVANGRDVSDLGAALALSGDTTRALRILTAEALSSRKASALSNAAAAHLSAAASGPQPRLAMLALDFASHALSREPAHAAALYNQAVALDALHLVDEAASVWRRYLQIDRSSPWGDAARARVSNAPAHAVPAAANLEALLARAEDGELLARACVDAPQPCREWIEESLLPEWGHSFLRGDAATAAAILRRARHLGSALARRGDSLDLDGVVDIERALPMPRRIVDLAEGFQAYGRARAAFEQDEPSIPLFAEAERRLLAAKNPLVAWVRCNRVYAELNTYSGARLEEVGRTLRLWTDEALGRGALALAGRLAYLEAVTFINRAQYAAAEPRLAVARDSLERANDAAHLASTRIASASARLRLGDEDAGWTELAQTLAALPEIRSRRRRYVVLLNVGMWLGERAMPYAALHLLTGARETAIQSRQTLRVAESSLYLAKSYARISDLARARADLELARPDPEKNGQWGRGERARAEYLAGVAEIEAEAQPMVALRAAIDSLAFFQGRSAPQRLASLYLMRARAHAAAGDLSEAEADVAEGIQSYERYRAGLTSSQQRVLSQDVVWDLYEQRLRLAVARSPIAALEAAENARALTLLESLRDSRRPVSASELQSLLARDVRVLYYALLPRELLVWSIGRDGALLHRVAVDRASIEQTAASFAEALAQWAPRRDWQAASEQLFDWVIRPAAAAVGDAATVIVVPDGALHRVPFSALLDRRTGRFLLDDHLVAAAPSATVLAQWLGRTDPLAPPRSLFIVSNPAVTGSGLPPLPGAERGASEIAPLYPESQLIARERATKAAFLTSAPRADVVHFAGHAVTTPELPLASASGVRRRARTRRINRPRRVDIAGMRLDQTQLVVLAACTTAGGVIRRGEGLMSLARPFFLAGAPAVIATLWDVDDDAAAAFLTDFHLRFVRTGQPAMALRETQLARMADLPSSIWAGFVLIGRPGRGMQEVTTE